MQDPTNSRTCTNYRLLEDKRGWHVLMVKQIQEKRSKKEA